MSSHKGTLETFFDLRIPTGTKIKALLEVVIDNVGMSSITGIEQRIESRQDVGNKIVQLEAKPGAGLVDCLIVDVSDRGACLIIPRNLELARIVHIVIGECRAAAWVAWRKEAQIGIEFLSDDPHWTKLTGRAP